MPETLPVLAGDYCATFEDERDRRRERGHLVSIIKLDTTEKQLVGRPARVGRWST